MARLNILILCLLLLPVSGLSAAESGLVDPLRPAQFTSPAKQAEKVQREEIDRSAEWQLTSVLIAPGRSVAVIDGQSVRLGGEFKGYRLSEIKADQVSLTSLQRTIILRRSGSGLIKNRRAR